MPWLTLMRYALFSPALICSNRSTIRVPNGFRAGGIQVIEHNQKFIAAKPRHEVLRTDTVFDGSSNALNQLVASVVPQLVVNLLEAVDIDKADGGPVALYRRLCLWC